MKRLYGGVLLLMAGIAAVSIGITALLGQYRTRREDGFAVMASFYPMYTAALQVAEGIDGVTVSCLTQPQTGCLHDYQLSPGEMIALKEADILVLNGAGAETFLSSALAQLPGLRVADTSEGIPLLEGQGHTHEHDGSETAEEHAHAVNEHIWMSPARYARQVENLRMPWPRPIPPMPPPIGPTPRGILHRSGRWRRAPPGCPSLWPGGTVQPSTIRRPTWPPTYPCM